MVEGDFYARERSLCEGIRVDGGLLVAVDNLNAYEWEACSEKIRWKLNCLVCVGAVVVARVVKRSLVRPGGDEFPKVESIM